MPFFKDGCIFCGTTDGALYRVNAKGEPGKFACTKHIKNTDATIDPIVKEIAELIAPPKNGR